MKSNGKVIMGRKLDDEVATIIPSDIIKVLFCHHGHYDPNLHDYGIRKVVREEMQRRENAIMKITENDNNIHKTMLGPTSTNTTTTEDQHHDTTSTGSSRRTPDNHGV